MSMSAVDALFQRVDMLDQCCKGLANGIGQVVVFKVRFFIGQMYGMIAHHDLSRNADYYRIGWSRSDNHRVRSNARVVPNGDRSQYLGARADDDMIADSGMTFCFTQTGAAQ